MTPGKPYVHRRSHASRRTGSAVTELAVFLPVLVMCVFGSIELSSGIFLRNSLTIAAYEGVRAAAYFGSKPGEALPVAQSVLTDRGITGYSVTFTTPNPESTKPGDPITIRVSAPTGGTNCYRFMFLPATNFTVESTMIKE